MVFRKKAWLLVITALSSVTMLIMACGGEAETITVVETVVVEKEVVKEVVKEVEKEVEVEVL